MDIHYKGNLLTLYTNDDKQEKVQLVDGVVVIARWGRGNEFVMIRTHRNNRIGSSLEFPGGKIEPKETPMDAAERELKEEVGMEGYMEYYTTLYSAPAILDSCAHIFICKDAEIKTQDIEYSRVMIPFDSMMNRTDQRLRDTKDALTLACISLIREISWDESYID